MKKKSTPKISYRDLLAPTGDAPAAPPASTPVTPAPAAAKPAAAAPAAAKPVDAAAKPPAKAPAKPPAKAPDKAPDKAPRTPPKSGGAQGPSGAPAERPAPPAAEALAASPAARAPLDRARARTPVEPARILNTPAAGAPIVAPPPAAVAPSPPTAVAPVVVSAPSPAPAPEPPTASAPLETTAPAERVPAPTRAAPRLGVRERILARQGTVELLLFRLGNELFAVDLAGVEEAVELPRIHRLPEMPDSMLGVFDLRGRLVAVYTPSFALGAPLGERAAAALIVRDNRGTGEGRRIAIAVDDVEDVFHLDLSTLRAAPGLGDEERILLGVARHGAMLVAIADIETLTSACLLDRAMETA